MNPILRVLCAGERLGSRRSCPEFTRTPAQMYPVVKAYLAGGCSQRAFLLLVLECRSTPYKYSGLPAVAADFPPVSWTFISKLAGAIKGNERGQRT